MHAAYGLQYTCKSYVGILCVFVLVCIYVLVKLLNGLLLFYFVRTYDTLRMYTVYCLIIYALFIL